MKVFPWTFQHLFVFLIFTIVLAGMLPFFQPSPWRTEVVSTSAVATRSTVTIRPSATAIGHPMVAVVESVTPRNLRLNRPQHPRNAASPTTAETARGQLPRTSLGFGEKRACEGQKTETCHRRYSAFWPNEAAF